MTEEHREEYVDLYFRPLFTQRCSNGVFLEARIRTVRPRKRRMGRNGQTDGITKGAVPRVSGASGKGLRDRQGRCRRLDVIVSRP